MAGGRPTKITPEICDAILKEIKEGVPEGTAAELAGVTRRTLINWKNRAKQSKRKNQYTEFFHRLQAAKAYAVKKHLKAIMTSKDWKAQRWLISLLDNDYDPGEKIQLEHSGEVKGQVDVSIHDRIKEYEGYFNDLDSKPESSDNSDNTRE